MDIYTLENPCLRARVTSQGACTLSLETVPNSAAILRPWDGSKSWHPADSAMFPMLPFANRIAGNRFVVGDREYHLPKNEYNDPFYLHGNGWLAHWDVSYHDETTLVFCLKSATLAGYEFTAELKYSLHNDEFHTEATLIHTGAHPMPYGIGFHPYFLLSPEDRVQFSSTGFWTEDEHHLPVEWYTHDHKAGLDFSTPLSPSGRWINNGYSGWNGVANIVNDQHHIAMRCDTPWLMVFQTHDGGFICLEPQTHQVNAHHAPGRPGLRMLNKGDSLHLKMVISVSAHRT
ncbi:aldose 1-epimerase [Pectobacterium sp. B1J-3]|uniref:aldose 1-epimerase n=1 Tax=Pectobacterium sp. B1J-3 TaxID=3385371 RepID=UPI003906622C